jgi:hypothetical protein
LLSVEKFQRAKANVKSPIPQLLIHSQFMNLLRTLSQTVVPSRKSSSSGSRSSSGSIAIVGEGGVARPTRKRNVGRKGLTNAFAVSESHAAASLINGAVSEEPLPVVSSLDLMVGSYHSLYDSGNVLPKHISVAVPPE